MRISLSLLLTGRAYHWTGKKKKKKKYENIVAVYVSVLSACPIMHQACTHSHHIPWFQTVSSDSPPLSGSHPHGSLAPIEL